MFSPDRSKAITSFQMPEPVAETSKAALRISYVNNRGL